MALAVLLIGAWAVASIRIALAEADTLLKHVLTRTLVLKHFEPAAYFVRLWFARLVQRPDLTLLLALGHQAAKALHVLPRVRSVAIATTSLQLVTDMADEVLERRLRTDGASGRTTSWVRILTRRFFRGFVRKSGAAAAAQLLSAVLLAVPPSREQAWSDKPQQSLEASPDIDEYLKIVLSGLPVQADESALQRIQEQLHSDGSRAGIDWFTAVAARAEEWRQEALPPHRDCRIEMLGEVVWGVYENAVGPRPPQYDIYDQLRLQLPDLLEGLAVRDVEIDGDTLSLSLRGLPSAFHDLTFGVGHHRTGADLALETRDGQSWRFERLEAGDGRAVHVVFRTVKQ
jgi:hypothetical protein